MAPRTSSDAEASSMPILNRVPELVAQKFEGGQINMMEVQRDTGLNYITVSKWIKGQVDRADFATLDKWCEYLDCEVGDILIRVNADEV